ncbi:hypothetical protein CTEN210_18286 [Chaetoceros tenuissimus]|uniref:Uncharacterized protein n=1 Tax=Chaetoceros tenuissimus TaxID=426638 RepID=A0AAD3DF13_9STRA|nr:hypothetical protein CTEN210_18286 [Chaetoceros tenuissimus]
MTTSYITLLSLLSCISLVVAFAASSPQKAILVTGANKGQGYALCERILTEHDDTCVFLCSRDLSRGEAAATELSKVCDSNRIHVVQLDVTDASSVSQAIESVKEILGNEKLYGVVSNAGILWGYPLSELLNVCTTGVYRVLDGLLPLMQNDGRMIVVSSGLGPLMHEYASTDHQQLLQDPALTWDKIKTMMEKCLNICDTVKEQDQPTAFEEIGFSGGPFAVAAPDFHMYGLAKMFADAYMLLLSRQYPNLRINSVDPGLVYSDLILKMDRYKGKDIKETGAQTPKQGVEAAMRLLFDDVGKGSESGKFYAMNKAKTELVFSEIDKQPEQEFASNRLHKNTFDQEAIAHSISIQMMIKYLLPFLSILYKASLASAFLGIPNGMPSLSSLVPSLSTDKPTAIAHPKLQEYSKAQSNIILNVDLDIPECIDDRFNPNYSRLCIQNFKFQLWNETSLVATACNGQYFYTPLSSQSECSSDVHQCKILKEGTYSSLQGVQSVSFENASWQMIWNKDNSVGTLVLGFHLFQNVERNDAILPAGNVYLSFSMLHQNSLQEFKKTQEEYTLDLQNYYSYQSKSLEDMQATTNVFRKLLIFKESIEEYNKIMQMKETFAREVPTVESIGKVLFGINQDLLLSAQGRVWYRPFDYDAEGESYELVGYAKLK